ncbi:MAG: hypothetical protein AB8G77_21895 [Rhodothermales bacterium]
MIRVLHFNLTAITWIVMSCLLSGCETSLLEEQDYFPLSQGAEWTYHFEAQSFSGSFSTRRLTRGTLRWQYEQAEIIDNTTSHSILESFEGTTDYQYSDGNNNWEFVWIKDVPLSWDRVLVINEQQDGLRFQYNEFTRSAPDSLWEGKPQYLMDSHPLTLDLLPEPLPRFISVMEDSLGESVDGYFRKIWTLSPNKGLVLYDWHRQSAEFFRSQKLTLIDHSF